MDGIYSGREKMTKKELQEIKYGTPVQAGLDFKGLVWKVEHIIETPETDLWRVWFINQEPVVSVDMDARKIIEIDGTHIRRQDDRKDCN